MDITMPLSINYDDGSGAAALAFLPILLPLFSGPPGDAFPLKRLGDLLFHVLQDKPQNP